MGTFDDIFESIDDITSVEENAPEREKLGVSEAEKKMGMWNAQDDGDAWTSDPVAKRGPGGPTVIKGPFPGAKSPHPTIGPMSKDDRLSEDEVLDEFIDGEDEWEEDEPDGGGGAFDDLF